MGQKTLTIELQESINEIPKSLEKYNLNIGDHNRHTNNGQANEQNGL